jgi:hypothetical protein
MSINDSSAQIYFLKKVLTSHGRTSKMHLRTTTTRYRLNWKKWNDLEWFEPGKHIWMCAMSVRVCVRERTGLAELWECFMYAEHVFLCVYISLGLRKVEELRETRRAMSYFWKIMIMCEWYDSHEDKWNIYKRELTLFIIYRIEIASILFRDYFGVRLNFFIFFNIFFKNFFFVWKVSHVSRKCDLASRQTMRKGRVCSVLISDDDKLTIKGISADHLLVIILYKKQIS